MMDLLSMIGAGKALLDGVKEGKEYLDKKKAEREAEEARARKKARILFFVFVVLPIILVVTVMLVWGLPKDNSKTASIQQIKDSSVIASEQRERGNRPCGSQES